MEKTLEKIKALDKRVTTIEKFIEKDGLSRNGRLIHCEKCGNSWITHSSKIMVSCSSCGNKTKIK